MKRYPLKRMSKEIANIRKQIENLSDDLDRRVVLLQQVCSHPSTEIKCRDIRGSYLDKSEHHEITVCSICGTELNDKVSYGWYA